MKKNKQILKHCPNFYKIINFEFFDDDIITERIISFYKEYIFTIALDNAEDIQRIEKIDYILNKYIDDYGFRKEIQRKIVDIRVKDNNFALNLINGIIELFDNYEVGYTRNIYFARWI